MSSIDELRRLAATVAEQVGREVIDRRRQGLRWETKSSVTDLVTEVDTWAEAAVVSRLDRARPGDGFLGEEGTNRPTTSGITWIIDPIDGTTNLLHDLPGYSVSIAAAEGDRVLAGAVYDPVRTELFTASAAHGATRNDVPIRASGTHELSRALIGTGFSYRSDQRPDQARALGLLLPRVRDVRRLGGAAIDLCSVACGRLDGFYERGLSKWDSAAGALIATEAGAVAVEDALTWAAAPDLALPFLELLEHIDA